MSLDDLISQLRAELARLSGPARGEKLIRLTQALANRYWRRGPGVAEGLGDLNAAIDASEEAYGYLEAGDSLRSRAAALFGMLVAIRHSLHGGVAEDRDRAIRIIDEALTFEALPPVQVTTLRFQLGQLLYFRALGGTNHEAMMASILGGTGTPWAGDVDRANECFRAVLAAPISPDIINVAQTMLDVGEAMQDMLSIQSGPLVGGGMDRTMAAMTKMQGAITKLQTLMQHGKNSPLLPGISLFEADLLAGMDPLDRPVMVVQGEEPAASPAPPVQRPEPAQVDRAALREALHAKLWELAGGAGGDVEIWAAAAGLLHPDAAMPDADAVDDLVALSTLVVEEQAADPATLGVDWLVHAVALGLRDRLDGTGDGADRAAGAEGILLAVQAIPDHHPAAVTIFGALGAFLAPSPTSPGGLSEPVAAGYADRVDAILVSGAVLSGADLATLHALRCVCRASAGEAADLQRAVGTVPLEYPWLATLKAISSGVSVPR